MSLIFQKAESKGSLSSLLLHKRLMVYFAVFILSFSFGYAQQLVLLKVFSEDLKPLGNISVSINQGPYFSVPASGSDYVNLSDKQFPIKTITTSDNSLEAASWNFSKGILEVTIRKKSYREVKVKIVDAADNVLKDVPVQFNGEKEVRLVSNNQGVITLPLRIGEVIKDGSQFIVKGFTVVNFNPINNQLAVVKLEEIASNTPDLELQEEKTVVNWDLYVSEKLPFIEDIQSFYAFMTIVPADKIGAGSQMLIDQKFDMLLKDLKKEVYQDSTSYIQQISDTTVLQVDIENLIRQMMKDGEFITEQKSEFKEKIELVRDKLKYGFENLTADDKRDLLANINLLEAILVSNKSEFIDGQNSYKAIINELKRRFFDLQALENKLTESELERENEKKLYQRRMLATLGVVLVFALLIILLFYLRNRIKRQHKELLNASEAIKSTNENLETLVSERTHLLEQTFKELDLVLYRASHDLRAPICSIAGLSDLIARDSGSSELTNLVLKTNNRMDKLLKKLSTISEVHRPGDFKVIQVEPFLQQIIDGFNKQIKLNDISIVVEVPEELQIKTIPTLFEAILTHLLENAIYFSQFTNEGQAQVKVSVSIRDTALKINVEDNGPGIDKDLIGKLFDMFYIGSEYSKGNGLGLYIVKKSVDILSGMIEVSSTENIATTFNVTIPLNIDQPHVLNFLSSDSSLEFQN